MTREQVIDKFNRICTERSFDSIHIKRAKRIVTMITPDNVEISDDACAIILTYFAEGIIVHVEWSKAIIHDLLRDKCTTVFDMDKTLDSVLECLHERKLNCQVETLRSITGKFDCTAEWFESDCNLTIHRGSYVITVTVRPNYAYIGLRDSYDKPIAYMRRIDTSKVGRFRDCVSCLIKSIDEYVRMSTDAKQAEKTSLFSDATDLCGKDNTQGYLNLTRFLQDRAYTYEITSALGEDQSDLDCSTVDQVQLILSGLMHNINNKSSGTYADGWREALLLLPQLTLELFKQHKK